MDSVMALAAMIDAVGVYVAHSGTAVGLLLLDDPDQPAWAAGQAEEGLPDLTAVHQHQFDWSVDPEKWAGAEGPL